MNLAERIPAHPDDRVALVVHDRTTHYGELADRVDRWRGALLQGGFEPGARVAILAGNNEVFVVGYLAIVSAGLVAVPLNPLAPVAALRRELAAVQAAAIIVGEAGQSTWQVMAHETDAPRAFLADGSAVPELDRGTPAPVVSVDDDHPAVFLFTSGTSGTSKPAVLSHGNLAASLRSLAQLPNVDLAQHHRVLAVIPLFHVFGLNVIVNLGLMVGATLVLEDHVAAARTVALLRRHKISMLLGPPNMWAAFAAQSGLEPSDFETVQIAVSGAAKLPPKTWLDLNDRLHLDVREGYGLTETCATVASSAGVDSPPGSVGVPMPGVELRLLGEDGEDVLIGDEGEIVVRGPMVSAGYWVDEALTPISRDAEGWLHTGDVGIVDDNGHLSVVSRIKDLIIVSGFNVHPGEVEQALESFDGVAEVAAYGEPTPDQGEQVVAAVVCQPGKQIDPLALQQHAAEQLARYKVPRRIDLVDELPHGLVGKLLRRELRQE